MKSRFSLGLVCIAVIAMLAGWQSVQAASVAPSVESQCCNPTCWSLGFRTKELKIESPTTGTYSRGEVTFTITVRNTGLGQVFDWTSSGGQVQAVYVKGGPNGNLYKYDPPATGDTGLHAPLNKYNNKYYGLSYISFCYTPGVAKIDVTKTCKGQELTWDATTKTNAFVTANQVKISNPGTFFLGSIMLKETIESLACSIIKVNGIELNPPVSLPTNVYTSVPSAGGFDGALDVGEVANVLVQCSGSKPNIANTIVAKGTSVLGDLEKAASNDPKEECPIPVNPKISIKKDCDSVTMAPEPGVGLVVKVCNSITVKNESYVEPLKSVKVTDTLLGLDGYEVGSLYPQESEKIGPLCYYPTAPEQMVLENGEFATCPASFVNTARVEAISIYAEEGDPTAKAENSAQCKLCPPTCP